MAAEGASQGPGFERGSPSIRRLTALSTLALALIVFLVASALWWTTSLLQRSTAVSIRDARSQAVATELELSLLLHQRLSNLYVLTGEPELAEAREEIADGIPGLLEGADALVGSAEEQELLEAVAEDVTGYLEARERLEARGLGVGEIVRLIRPNLSEAVRRLESLGDLNDEQVRRANAEALRVERLSKLVALGAGALLALVVVAIVVGVRRYLLQPLLGLHEAVARLRSGKAGARAELGGTREVGELGRGLNEMADMLQHQREAQLTFLAGVAHDLRNPLSGLKLGIQALENEQSEARRRRTRERLDRQVDRLARMIEDLLDATRIEAGNLELQIEEFDLREVVEDMVRLYAPTSPDHQISADAPSDPVMVRGDPLRIEQVVSNLLSNAIKFSPGGGPVGISVGVEEDEAVLRVSDRGIGISSDDLATIFLPFRRRKLEVAPGAGLGLSVVRHITTAHGGSIEVESQPGEGSTFRVRIPRTASAD